MRDIRADILEDVRKITPFDDVEMIHLDDAVRWIESGVGIFRLEKPATPPKHLVTYFVVVDDSGLLLVDHKKAQLWLPSGGHVEVDEHPRMTVCREIREELGLDAEFVWEGPLMLTVTETVGVTAGHWDVTLWYVVRADRTRDLLIDEDEFVSSRWFDWNDLPLARDPNLSRFVAKWRAVSTQISE